MMEFLVEDVFFLPFCFPVYQSPELRDDLGE
jgi:hypothetical protein